MKYFKLNVTDHSNLVALRIFVRRLMDMVAKDKTFESLQKYLRSRTLAKRLIAKADLGLLKGEQSFIIEQTKTGTQVYDFDEEAAGKILGEALWKVYMTTYSANFYEILPNYSAVKEGKADFENFFADFLGRVIREIIILEPDALFEEMEELAIKETQTN